MIYLLPWKEEPYNYGAFEIYYFRKDFNDKVYAQVTFDTGNGKYYISAWSVIDDDSFSSLEEATAKLDKYLLILKHFYLIPEDHVDRFKEKLVVLI